MKKKLALIMTVALTMGLFAGCGSDENTESSESNTGNAGTASNTGTTTTTVTETISVADMKVEDYVTLGEYKGLAVTVAEPTVTDAEVEEHMQKIYNSYITAEYGVTDRAVAVGDTVNIDYEGKKDGVAFSGGTATGQQLTIGSGQFIDGFEDGLVDVMPGETVDLNLTFPENYGNEELNGQAVVFTVTVNYICPGVEEFADEAVASFGNSNFTNVEEMRDFSYNYLNESAQASYTEEVEAAVMQTFIDQCEFKELPEDLVAKYRATIQENVEITASVYSTDAETICYYFYGMELEEFLDTYSVESAKQVISFQAVANKEGLTMSDEELETTLSEFATANGYTSVDEFLGTNTRDEYKEYYMFEDVLAFLVENAVVTAE